MLKNYFEKTLNILMCTLIIVTLGQCKFIVAEDTSQEQPLVYEKQEGEAESTQDNSSQVVDDNSSESFVNSNPTNDKNTSSSDVENEVDEKDDGIAPANEESNEAVVQENSVNLTFKINDEEVVNDVTYKYGDNLVFSLSGTSVTPSFSYETEDDYINKNNAWESIESGQLTLNPGIYYFNYLVIINDDPYTETFRVVVDKGIIPSPINLIWDNSQMKWDAVTTTSTGGALLGNPISGYEVTIYKNDVEITKRDTTDNKIENFANVILSDYKEGVYSFKVKAKLKDDKKDYYVGDSSYSDISSDYTVPNITLLVDEGSSITNDNIKNFILIPGNESHNNINISVEVAQNFSFTKWEVQEEVDGISFENVNSASTKLTIGSSYNGGTSLKIKAVTHDDAAPVIKSFNGSDGKLSASVQDNETGVYAYAFTKKILICTDVMNGVK